MNVIVYGLGAIGSNLMLQMSKMYPEFKYIGFDYDKIEERNIKTQAYFIEQVGMPKVNAMQILMQRFNRKIKYLPNNKKVIEPPNFNTEEYLVIDCFDNSESRKLLTGLPKPTIHIGFSPQYSAEIIWDETYDVPGDVDPEQNDICSMDEAVSFIHFTVNFAIMNISKWIKEDKKENYIITSKNIIRKL